MYWPTGGRHAAILRLLPWLFKSGPTYMMRGGRTRINGLWAEDQMMYLCEQYNNGVVAPYDETNFWMDGCWLTDQIDNESTMLILAIIANSGHIYGTDEAIEPILNIKIVVNIFKTGRTIMGPRADHVTKDFMTRREIKILDEPVVGHWKLPRDPTRLIELLQTEANKLKDYVPHNPLNIDRDIILVNDKLNCQRIYANFGTIKRNYKIIRQDIVISDGKLKCIKCNLEFEGKLTSKGVEINEITYKYTHGDKQHEIYEPTNKKQISKGRNTFGVIHRHLQTGMQHTNNLGNVPLNRSNNSPYLWMVDRIPAIGADIPKELINVHKYFVNKFNELPTNETTVQITTWDCELKQGCEYQILFKAKNETCTVQPWRYIIELPELFSDKIHYAKARLLACVYGNRNTRYHISNGRPGQQGETIEPEGFFLPNRRLWSVKCWGGPGMENVLHEGKIMEAGTYWDYIKTDINTYGGDEALLLSIPLITSTNNANADSIFNVSCGPNFNHPVDMYFIDRNIVVNNLDSTLNQRLSSKMDIKTGIINNQENIYNNFKNYNLKINSITQNPTKQKQKLPSLLKPTNSKTNKITNSILHTYSKRIARNNQTLKEILYGNENETEQKPLTLLRENYDYKSQRNNAEYINGELNNIRHAERHNGIRHKNGLWLSGLNKNTNIFNEISVSRKASLEELLIKMQALPNKVISNGTGASYKRHGFTNINFKPSHRNAITLSDENIIIIETDIWLNQCHAVLRLLPAIIGRETIVVNDKVIIDADISHGQSVCVVDYIHNSYMGWAYLNGTEQMHKEMVIDMISSCGEVYCIDEVILSTILSKVIILRPEHHFLKSADYGTQPTDYYDCYGRYIGTYNRMNIETAISIIGEITKPNSNTRNKDQIAWYTQSDWPGTNGTQVMGYPLFTKCLGQLAKLQQYGAKFKVPTPHVWCEHLNPRATGGRTRNQAMHIGEIDDYYLTVESELITIWPKDCSNKRTPRFPTVHSTAMKASTPDHNHYWIENDQAECKHYTDEICYKNRHLSASFNLRGNSICGCKGNTVLCKDKNIRCDKCTTIENIGTIMDIHPNLCKTEGINLANLYTAIGGDGLTDQIIDGMYYWNVLAISNCAIARVIPTKNNSIIGINIRHSIYRQTEIILPLNTYITRSNNFHHHVITTIPLNATSEFNKANTKIDLTKCVIIKYNKVYRIDDYVIGNKVRRGIHYTQKSASHYLHVHNLNLQILTASVNSNSTTLIPTGEPWNIGYNEEPLRFVPWDINNLTNTQNHGNEGVANISGELITIDNILKVRTKPNTELKSQKDLIKNRSDWKRSQEYDELRNENGAYPLGLTDLGLKSIDETDCIEERHINNIIKIYNYFKKLKGNTYIITALTMDYIHKFEPEVNTIILTNTKEITYKNTILLECTNRELVTYRPIVGLLTDKKIMFQNAGGPEAKPNSRHTIDKYMKGGSAYANALQYGGCGAANLIGKVGTDITLALKILQAFGYHYGADELIYNNYWPVFVNNIGNIKKVKLPYNTIYSWLSDNNVLNLTTMYAGEEVGKLHEVINNKAIATTTNKPNYNPYIKTNVDNNSIRLKFKPWCNQGYITACTYENYRSDKCTYILRDLGTNQTGNNNLPFGLHTDLLVTGFTLFNATTRPSLCLGKENSHRLRLAIKLNITNIHNYIQLLDGQVCVYSNLSDNNNLNHERNNINLITYTTEEITGTESIYCPMQGISQTGASIRLIGCTNKGTIMRNGMRTHELPTYEREQLNAPVNTIIESRWTNYSGGAGKVTLNKEVNVINCINTLSMYSHLYGLDETITNQNLPEGQHVHWIYEPNNVYICGGNKPETIIKLKLTVRGITIKHDGPLYQLMCMINIILGSNNINEIYHSMEVFRGQ
ncbi:ORF2 [Ceratobasidium endornavirus B]|uniref:ORF2 n=1 Tax=Ceratobasidium endornavirus B TaxID=1908807 RepID=UPI000870DC13|nr:ORF2 [Ceratobasidium endornavirus B]AOV81680.1 ORF2 [Ceratobasidium endornavirus B]